MADRFRKLRKERRFIVVPVDIQVFGDLVKSGVEGDITAEGLPKDAMFLSAEKDIFSQTFNFIYLHESFDKVDEGVCCPILNVILTRHTGVKS